MSHRATATAIVVGLLALGVTMRTGRLEWTKNEAQTLNTATARGGETLDVDSK